MRLIITQLKELIWKQLRFLTSRKRYFIDAGGAIHLTEAGFRSAEFVVSRKHCFYSSFDLSSVGKQHRKAVLDIQVKKWCPLDGYRQYVSWHDDCAQVWAIDASLVGGNSGFIPESVLVGGRRNEGAEIIELASGFEGRIWQQGRLLGSRWWALMPTSSLWRFFLRGGGLSPNLPLESTSVTRMSETTWAPTFVGRLSSAWISEKTIVGSLLFILLTMVVWKGTGLYYWQEQVRRLESHFSTESEELADILSVRAKVQRDTRVIDLYNSLKAKPLVLSVLADLAVALPEKGVTISEFSLSDATLKLVVEGARVDLPAYVNAFDALDNVTDVSATRGRDATVIMEMKVGSYDGQ